MRHPLLINGRFLAGERTAVNDVARELTRALGALLPSDRIALVVPPGLEAEAEELGLPVHRIGTGSGIAWEQTCLPAMRHEGVVAGFFNTVPLRGKGYVTLLHDAHVFRTPRSFGPATRIWRRALSRRAGAPGNLVLTLSDYARTTLLAAGIGGPDRIGRVANGLGQVGRVPPDPSILRTANLTPRRYALALSSLLPHKNTTCVLRAFRDPRLADLKLVLVGRTGRAAFDAAGHTVPPNVVFPGFVSDAALAALYGNALAVCVPSTEEGFGLPALEAMALGAPALVARCGALPEVVGDAGQCLDPHDATGWADAIHALDRDPAGAARFSDAGRARAQGFTWQRAAEAVCAHVAQWQRTGAVG